MYHRVSALTLNGVAAVPLMVVILIMAMQNGGMGAFTVPRMVDPVSVEPNER